MNRLAREALAITQDLGDVIFIGALATYMHARNRRDSQDIDFVVEKPIPDDVLLSKGYKKSMTGKQPWFSPRGIKIDIYSDGIPGASHDWIVKNSTAHKVGPTKSLRTLGLESLVVSKHRANRNQDVEDLTNIARRRYRDIDWSVVRRITGDPFVAGQIQHDMKFLHNG